MHSTEVLNTFAEELLYFIHNYLTAVICWRTTFNMKLFFFALHTKSFSSYFYLKIPQIQLDVLVSSETL